MPLSLRTAAVTSTAVVWHDFAMVEDESPWDSDPLDAVIRAMRRFDPSKNYYALTLGSNRRGHAYWSRFTHWFSYSERHPKWEIRAASLVNPESMSNSWQRLGQAWVAVHDDQQLALFMRVGGNMLVEKKYADHRLSDQVGPRECAPDGTISHGGGGFLVTEDLDDEAVERSAPSRKLRGRVLKRDDYRCVICGRRPRDHTDLELHVHHVIPWRMGGPTAEANLVTLCGSCHKGLDPDYEPRIRELANLPGPASPLDARSTEHHVEVRRYREIIKRILADDNG